MTPDTGSKQLLHDAALDRLIRQSPVVPPPAVGLHGLSSCDKSIGDLSKITLFKVVAEDESSGAYPACVETFGPQVILEHPVVTAWLGVQGCPDRGQVRNANWNPKPPEPLVENTCAGVPDCVELLVPRTNCRLVQVAEEFVHGDHDIRM